MKKKLLALCLSVALALYTFAGAAPFALAVTCANDGSVTNFVVSGSQCIGYIITTGAGTFTLPSDWSSTNTIEVIGGGGAGDNGKGSGPTGSRFAGGGGGGGAYSKVTNITVTSGASYSVGTGGTAGAGGGGAGGTGADTWFNGSTCTGASVCAKGGTGSSSASPGTGGEQTGNTGGVGTVKNLGGNGGTGGSGNGSGAGGGGGAAGGTGAGNTGGNGTSGGAGTGGAGGSGDAGAGGGSGTAPGGTGGNGAEWTAISVGSGGGGGGGSNTSPAGGPGGNYGAGGGGSYGSTAGAGIQGIIVITYTPTVPSVVKPSVSTLSAETFTPTTATLFGQITNAGGANATQSGFAWATSASLTTGVTTTTLGAQTGTASFNSSLTGLSGGITYYYRAYATNSAGTGYGSILSFTTGDSTPTRRLRLFEGFVIKLISGTLKLFGL